MGFCQTLFSKKTLRQLKYFLLFKPYLNPCYNLYMGRNHFSRAGGPYFINDGFSRHADKPYDIPSKGFFYLILSGFVITLAAIVTLLYLL